MEKLNLETIKARLLGLGFDSHVEEKLMAQVCFNPPDFEVRFTKTAGEDQCSFIVQVERGSTGEYAVVGYTACFRKGVMLGTSSRLVADRMAAIDWNLIGFYRGNTSLAGALVILREAGEVLQDAAKLAEYSLVLYKYWAGTSLEGLTPQLGSLKSRYEISQRFYVSEDHAPFTADEAMRFLQNRWMERQMQQGRLQRRQAELGHQEPSPKKSAKKAVRKK